MSCRFTLKLTQGRREFCIPYTCLVFQIAPGNVLCRHNIHLMGYFEFLHDSRMVCLPLGISEKLHWRRGRTSSSSLLIQSNTLLSGEQHRPFKQTRTNTIFFSSFGYQFCTWSRFGPFCRTNVLVVLVESIWLLLSILFSTLF